MRSLRPASCCRVEVVNGAAGRRVYGFVSSDVTVSASFAVPLSASDSEVACASSRTTAFDEDLSWPRSSKSRPVATFVSSTESRRALNGVPPPASARVMSRSQ